MTQRLSLNIIAYVKYYCKLLGYGNITVSSSNIFCFPSIIPSKVNLRFLNIKIY